MLFVEYSVMKSSLLLIVIFTAAVSVLTELWRPPSCDCVTCIVTEADLQLLQIPRAEAGNMSFIFSRGSLTPGSLDLQLSFPPVSSRLIALH